MRIFILEDDGTRMALFQDVLQPEHAIVHRSSVDRAIAAMKSGPFDLFLLDHDLGEFKFYGDGSQFAAWLVEKRVRPVDVVIHSWNGDGAARMEKTLKEGGWPNVARVPFGLKLIDHLRTNILGLKGGTDGR